MKKIKKVQLALNPEMETVVTADILMHNENDIDDVYFVMFNILHDPLRFVVATVSDFASILQHQGNSRIQVQTWLKNDPEEFMRRVFENQQGLFENAQEKVRVTLDSPENAMMARAVVTSMIDKGYYWQHSNYGDDKPKIQQIPTTELLLDLNNMLDIIKDWENFDLGSYLISHGASQEDVDAMLNRQEME